MKEKKHNDPKTTGDDLSDRRQDRRNPVQNFLDSVVRKSALVLDPNGLYKENRDEEIVALRGWNLAVNGNDNYFLQSPTWGIDPWPKRRPFESVCIPRRFPRGPRPSGRGLLRRRTSPHFPHDPPHAGCWCGVYGLKSGGVLLTLGDISGEVYLFGDYVEHDLGFRGQYGYPKSLRWFWCSYCHTGYRMNDIRIPRISGATSQDLTDSKVPLSCKFCVVLHPYGNGIDLIPLSYVIEKLEHEYDLEVYR